MNFLAHAYLSGDNTDVLVGNFLADAVKGKSYTQFDQAIQQGILLHREIDTFTDEHPINQEARAWLRPTSGKFSGVALDILYDYCLANSGRIKHLEKYANRVYEELDEFSDLFEGRLKRMYPYMKEFNWLLGYQTEVGISRALVGVGKRFPKPVDLSDCAQFALENKRILTQYFEAFFPELEAHCQQYLERNE